MYEENCQSLPDGDASVVFAEQFGRIQRLNNGERVELAPDNVVRWADPVCQSPFGAICRRLLLPGSGISGVGNLRVLTRLAKDGNSCLLCMNHRSNLDVPTLATLLEDFGEPELFKSIIWISGRKLEEDVGLTSTLVQCVNRVIVTPHSWFSNRRSDHEIHVARSINIAAERAVANLKNQGWVFALFPAGTRIRTDDPTTQQAIEETDSYLRGFDYLCLGNIDGCTMPVTKGHDMTHETPKLDRMLYTFGAVTRTDQWRVEATRRFPELEAREATSRAMTQGISALSPQEN